MRNGVVRVANCYFVVDGMMGGGFRPVTGVPMKRVTAGRVVCKAFLFNALVFASRAEST